MKGRKNRADPERFFPKEEASLEGALKKMSYLRQNTDIRVQVPLKQQIYDLIKNSSEGLTVQEISAILALNTKTCAKVLDEMIFKHQELKATAHRYGRVFVHKYHVLSSKLEEDEKIVQQDLYCDLPEEIASEIRTMETSTGEIIKNAISQSLKDEKKHSRQRITEQGYVRALFVVSRIQKLKVCSVYDIKEMIRNELEPNAKWCLDKKTVLRIIWKLRNCSLLKELCFRIKLRKDDDHEVTYLGSHYDCILEDKRSNRNSNIIYKLLAAIPEIEHTDPLVTECAAIKNPTNRKPFPHSSSLTKPVINIKSKLIRDIALVQNSAYKKLKNSACVETVLEGITLMQMIIEGNKVEDLGEGPAVGLAKAYSLAIFAKSIFKMIEIKVNTRYNLFFDTFRMPLCYTALKETFNKPPREIEEKYRLAYADFCLEKSEPKFLPCEGKVKVLATINLPKKRKHTLEEMQQQVQKIFLLVEKKPGVLNDELVTKVGKRVDTNPVLMLSYLEDLGITSKREEFWEFSPKYLY